MGDRTARLLLVRHGESETNAHAAHVVGGRSSWSELTERGKAQARALGRLWAKVLEDDHLVIASTAVRATQTARYALDAAGRPLTRLQTRPELEELDQGEWTGLPRVEVYTDHQRAAIDEDQWTFRPPGGESQADVFGRVSRLLAGDVLEPGRCAWVVCHGVVITSLLAGWLELDRQTAWRIHIANASVTELRYDDRGFHEVRRGDVEHLADAAALSGS